MTNVLAEMVNQRVRKMAPLTLEGSSVLFEELEKAIKAYEEENYTTLYRRSSRTINAARKRAPHRHFVDKLVYYKMDLVCVHGGREYISKSQEKRRKQRYAGEYPT